MKQKNYSTHRQCRNSDFMHFLANYILKRNAHVHKLCQPFTKAMRYLVSATLIIVGIIHLLPVIGVISSERLTALYGVSFSDPNAEILMRHRAILFGLLGLFLVYAAFQPTLQIIAFVAGFVSILSFLMLAWLVGGYNAQVARVFVVDIAALICLVIGVLGYIYLQRNP